VAFADEFIDVIKALVVAHVDDVTPVAIDDSFRALMFHAAKRSALFGRGGGIERINLDHPAKAIDLV
jgi:hypothetical protein